MVRTKYLSALFFLVLFSGAAANAQTFDSEKDIRNPVKLPAGILKILRDTRLVAECVEQGEPNASWFRAAKIDLNGDKFADYVVKSNKDCLNGPRAAGWWRFRPRCSPPRR